MPRSKLLNAGHGDGSLSGNPYQPKGSCRTVAPSRSCPKWIGLAACVVDGKGELGSWSCRANARTSSTTLVKTKHLGKAPDKCCRACSCLRRGRRDCSIRRSMPVHTSGCLSRTRRGRDQRHIHQSWNLVGRCCAHG